MCKIEKNYFRPIKLDMMLPRVVRHFPKLSHGLRMTLGVRGPGTLGLGYPVGLGLNHVGKHLKLL